MMMECHHANLFFSRASSYYDVNGIYLAYHFATLSSEQWWFGWLSCSILGYHIYYPGMNKPYIKAFLIFFEHLKVLHCLASVWYIYIYIYTLYIYLTKIIIECRLLIEHYFIIIDYNRI